MIRLYNGYGHSHNLHIYGHVFSKPAPIRNKNKNGLLHNIIYLLRLFFMKPVPATTVVLQTESQTLKGSTEKDGFFSFEWEEKHNLPAGWHKVSASRKNEKAEGKVFIPHKTQLAFISDMDDTILVSHSSTGLKQLSQLLFKSPPQRKLFKDVALHYQLLAKAQTKDDNPNPFFYVSSSEWNLYDYLQEIMETHKMPEGVFLLSEIKRWYQLFKTGKTKHEGKLLRILRVFKTFPLQKFVLLGDNSQSDPDIYQRLVEKYPGKVVAVYIRNVNVNKETATQKILQQLRQQQVETCFFKKSEEAIAHSIAIGLINNPY